MVDNRFVSKIHLHYGKTLSLNERKWETVAATDHQRIHVIFNMLTEESASRGY